MERLKSFLKEKWIALVCLAMVLSVSNFIPNICRFYKNNGTFNDVFIESTKFVIWKSAQLMIWNEKFPYDHSAAVSGTMDDPQPLIDYIYDMEIKYQYTQPKKSVISSITLTGEGNTEIYYIYIDIVNSNEVRSEERRLGNTCYDNIGTRS